MPLLVHAVSWWLVGLWVGQTRALPVPAVLLAGVVACVLIAMHRLRAATAIDARMLTAWLGFAGVLVAHGAATTRERCHLAAADALRDGRTVWFVPADDNPARGVLHVDVSCAASASIQWRRRPTTLPADTPGTLALRGRALLTPRGVRVLDAETVPATTAPTTAPTSLLERLRQRAGRTIDRHFGVRAPLVRALLIADQDGIPSDVRDRYADAGLVHLLSVSGMHVAIIAGAIVTAGSLLHLAASRVEAGALILVTLYVALLGFPAPAVRSGVMLVVMSLAKRWQRPVHGWTALALGAAVPTVNPLVVTDLGWQLSVGGMAALIAARALRARWRRFAAYTPPIDAPNDAWPVRALRWLGGQHGVVGWLVAETTTGVVAVALTAPIIAWTFARVSLIAPLSNLAAGPLIALLQPTLFLALVLAPWPVAAQLVADASQPLMALLDRIAAVAAAPSWAVWPVAPTLASALLTGAAAAIVVRATAARRRTPWLVAAGTLVVIAVWRPLLARGSGRLELHVIDVGQGDALAVRTPRGRWVVMDAGGRWEGGDAARRALIPHLQRLGGSVALFVLSHPHDDHAGGAESLVSLLTPRAWWEAAFVSASPGYRAALNALRARGVPWSRVAPGKTALIDGVTFAVLAPDSAWTAEQVNANETSIVMQVRYGAHRFLLTGDAEAGEEAWLLDHYAPDVLRSDVLKVGHHGSRSSSSGAFLDAVRPRIGVVSLGAGNRYGHPAPETLEAFAMRGIPVLRTDVEGTLVVSSDGESLSVEARGELWNVPKRTLHAFHSIVPSMRATIAAISSVLLPRLRRDRQLSRSVLPALEPHRGQAYSDVRRHHRTIHHRAGAHVPGGYRRVVRHPLRYGARRQDDREQGAQCGPRRHPRCHDQRERAG